MNLITYNSHHISIDSKRSNERHVSRVDLYTRQMRISARADYALRATIEIASRAPEVVKAEDIAEAQGVPVKFLEAILLDLRRMGIVLSKRGAKGGYYLNRDANEVSLAEVIRAVEGPLMWVSDERPGTIEYSGSAESLRDVWIAVRASLRGVLDHVSVAQVVRGELPPKLTELIESDPSDSLIRTALDSGS